MIQSIVTDLRIGVRTLWQNPGFAAVAILSLALGIGVNTAIFSLMDALLLKDLPVEDPGRLVLLSDPGSAGVSVGTEDGVRSLFTFEEFDKLRARSQVFRGMFAAESSARGLSVAIGGGPLEELHPRLVTGDYFSTLGVKPLLGRVFTPRDERAPGSDPYVVISYPYWKRRFGLDASVLGQTVQIQQAFFTIIGVTPPGFLGETIGEAPDAWLPMMMEPLVKPGRDWLHDDPSKAEKVMWLLVAGRLKPDVTPAQAESSLNVLFQQIVHETAGSNLPPERLRESASEKIRIQSGRRGASQMRDQFHDPLIVLMAVVGLVLLIACANVANLQLARATRRRRETGIRLAIGAGRGRLVRQWLTESVLLSLAGGAIGILFAFWTDHLLLQMAAAGPKPLPLDVAPDLRMLAFTGCVAILTGLLFGIAPAIRATRVDVSFALRESSRGVTGSGRRKTIGKALVIAQVALSLLLLVGAGLFLRTLLNLQRVDLGYARDNLLVMRVDTLAAGYRGARRASLFRTLERRFQAIPGVRGVAISENGLFSGTESGDRISVEGYKPRKQGDDSACFDQVGPNYFSTLGIPLLLGREIDAGDTETAARVCVIDETMARFFFENQNPIGKQITDEFPDTRASFRIVGVSKDDRDHRLRGNFERRFYVPLYQGIGGIPPEAYFEIRTLADPHSIVSAVRHQVEQVDRSLPITKIDALTDLLDRTLTQERLIAQLSTFFGALAVLLAAVGLYGVLSYSVAQRTNEIGIRMALGARGGSLLGMVMRETLLVVAMGIGLGVLLAVALSGLIASRLYGLQPADPLTIVLASALLAVVAMLAGYVPARRAAGVDPLIALRHE